MRRLPGIFIILFLFFSCEAAEPGKIDYLELNPIQVDLEREIGASGDFIPGDLTDLEITASGGVLVADRDRSTIDQFKADGTWLGLVARGGRGPGELPLNFSFIENGSDTLAVRLGFGSRYDYFVPGSDSLYVYTDSIIPERTGAGTVMILGPRSKSQFYAYTISPSGLSPMNYPAFGMNPVAVVNEATEIVEDSLHILKIPNQLVEIEPGVSIQIFGIPPFQYHDRLRVEGNGHYMIARPDSSALFFYNQNHELEKRIELNGAEQAVTEEDLDYILREWDREERASLEARIPEVMPPFLDVWLTGDFILLHTDTSREGKRMVVLDRNGVPAGTFLLSEFDEIQQWTGNRIYTLHQDPDSGHTIRTYRVELPG